MSFTDKHLLHTFFPFLKWWHRVTLDGLKSDGIAGLTGALLVLPQAVAFATIAGLPPEYGLYAALVPTIIAALFGSSWHLVSGPTTALSIVVFASVSLYAAPGSPEYIGMVLTLTFLAGVFQLLMGLAKMGTLVNFISHTVVIGFTAGAALIIAASQVRSFFGLNIERGTPAYEVMRQLLIQIGDLNPYITSVAVVSLIAGVLARRYFRAIPYMIVSMVVGGLLAALLNMLFGEAVTHIKTVGALAAHLPPLSLPDFSLPALQNTFFPALAVTVLGLTEAVSISRSIAMKSEQHISGNQEFIGQGLSNLVGSFFSGYVSSGSFNRSGANYDAGARTPLAAVFSSLFLLLVLFLVAPLAAYLPIPAMAAVLFLVAWNLIDFHHIALIFRAHREEAVVLGVSFLGTVIDLEKGIFFGIITSLLFYLYRTSKPAIRALVPDAMDWNNPRRKFVVEMAAEPECPQLKLLRIEGSIFFGAVDHIQQTFATLDEQSPGQKHLLLFSKGINTIDLAGAELLAREAQRRRKQGGALYLCGVREAACDMLKKGGYQLDIGADRVFAHKPDAIAAIYPRLDPDICRACPIRMFRECRERLPGGEARLAHDIEQFASQWNDPGAFAGPRLTAIVARGGDDGMTALAGGLRLPKHAPRIEAIGAVEELDGQLGVLLDASLPIQPRALLLEVQRDLLSLEMELMHPEAPQLHEEALLRLDQAMTHWQAALPMPFKLAGPVLAQLQVCRSVCRRAERRISALAAQEPLSPQLGRYLNRLAALLKVLRSG